MGLNTQWYIACSMISHQHVECDGHVDTCSQVALPDVQVAGILTGDAALIGRALGEETVVETARGPLIPGFRAVKAAAGAAGAFGCTISGAGPTMVAAVGDTLTGEAVAAAMTAAFRQAGGLEIRSVQIVGVDMAGARVVHVPE